MNWDPILSKVRIPTASDRVHKEECVYSFDTPFSEGGLYVDLNTFLAFSRETVKFHFDKSKNPIYLHIIKRKVPKQTPPSAATEVGAEPPKKKPTVLGIGVDGGFALDEEAEKFEVAEKHELVLLPNFEVIPWPDPSVPDKIKKSVETILAADSASKKDDVATWVASVKLAPSKFATALKQLDNGKKTPASGWKCEQCDLRENLWLNLTDGAILCGRRNFDGSGGNNHAVEHFRQTGYPLAVKLGTITKDGKADVYSYGEDNEVEDPLLLQHLAHFGINVGQLEKTDKSLAEMNVELNYTFDWNRVLTAGKKKEEEPVFGSPFTGCRNLGNTCYLASVMQVLMHLPVFQKRYANPAAVEYRNVRDPSADLITQLSKFANGVHSDRYSKPIKISETSKPYQDGINPRMLKALLGKTNRDFASNEQQDAFELYQFVLNQISRAEHAESSGKYDPTRSFMIRFEERIQCNASGQVRYVPKEDNIWSLPVPLTEAQQKIVKELRGLDAKLASGEKIDPAQRPRVPLDVCISAFAAPEIVSDFLSTATGTRGTATRTTRLLTFPDVLVLHMRKFQLDGWTARKLDVAIDVPDRLSVEALRVKGGLLPGEVPLPDVAAAAAPAAIVPNDALVQQLTEMGFPRVRCERAAVATRNGPADVAMEWLIAHMEDPDIDKPLPPPAAAAKPAGPAVNEAAVEMVMSMGFPRARALAALAATSNDVERATEWLFSHPEEMESTGGGAGGAGGAKKEEKFTDGRGEYALVAFITHLGNSPHSGHYVCHIQIGGKWYTFNDSKVSLCEEPPKDLAYLYFYQRV